MRSELDERLDDWAREYAGGRYEHNGWPGRSWLSNAIKYRGRTPEGLSKAITPIGTPADEVESAVVALERAVEGFKPGRVLRCEYWMPKAPEEMKIQALRAIGLPMSRAGYYIYLSRGRFHVAGWLRLPISDRYHKENDDGWILEPLFTNQK